MRIAAMAVMTVAMSGGAWAEAEVAVCMQFGADILPLAVAEKMASKTFAEIGVTVEWQLGCTWRVL